MNITVSIVVRSGSWENAIKKERSFDLGGGYYTPLADSIEKVGGEDQMLEELDLALSASLAYFNRVIPMMTPEEILQTVKEFERKKADKAAHDKAIEDIRKERDALKLKNQEQQKSLAMYECEMRGMTRQKLADEGHAVPIPDKSETTTGDDADLNTF